MEFQSSVPTIHIGASNGAVAKTLLMPGDPLRAKFIAEKYLTNPTCFNEVRGMLGFTGEYKGTPISVMGSGMGMPSMGIYSYELFAYYGVQNIIRIGTCGAASDDINIKDVILASRAYSMSNFAAVQSGFEGNHFLPSPQLNANITATAESLSMPLVHGAIRSGDVFYMQDIPRQRADYIDEVKAFEMEAFALFSNAKVLGKNAACLLTVTDKRSTHEALSHKEREQRMDEMFTLALESAIKA